MRKNLNSLSLLLISLALMLPAFCFGQELPSSPPPDLPLLPPERLSMPGRVEGAGTFFEIKGSEYLNISLTSSQEIKVVIESVPRMISTNIEPAVPEITISDLTIKGLEPNKTYYKYENSYKNLVVFIPDENGEYGWQQDLSQPNHVWFQEEKSTTFIDRDTVLENDISGSVEISANNIILDCGGHRISAGYSYTGYGVYLNRKQGVIIKDCVINGFAYAIYLNMSSNDVIARNRAYFNQQGISFSSSDNNIVENNIVDNNLTYNLVLDYSSANRIIGNSISQNYYGRGLYLRFSSNNYLRSNSLGYNKYNFGVLGSSLSHYLQDIDTSNTVSGKPIYYLVNEQDRVIDAGSNAGYVGVVNSANITVRDLTLEGNLQGVLFAYTQNSKIERVTAAHNENGIYVAYSGDNALAGNITSSNDSSGLRLDSSSANALNNNISSGNVYGISLGQSSGNTLMGNIMANNQHNFGISGNSDSHFANFVDSSNKVDSKPVYYLQNIENSVFDSSTNAGTFYCISCNNVTVRDLTLTKNGAGVFFWKTQNSKIENVTSLSNEMGIDFRQSTNNTLINATVSGNSTGIYLENQSNGNVLEANTVNSNSLYNIQLYGSNNNQILENTVTASVNGSFGIDLFYSSDNIIMGNVISCSNNFGIWLEGSLRNRVERNHIFGAFRYGIYIRPLWGSVAKYNHLIENTISRDTPSSSSYGVIIFRDGSNSVYHNNFINTSSTVYGDSIGNTFDNGYPSGGNYWSEFSGKDLKNGANQDLLGSDGIGDMPYAFPGGQDNYPFMKQDGWKIPQNQPPVCSIKLQKNKDQITKVNVAEFFDINVAESTSDVGINAVRFMSDELQNETTEGVWTDWFGWSVSSTDSENWNAQTKIARWSFATPGQKEVWAEIKDVNGLSSQCSANITAEDKRDYSLVTLDGDCLYDSDINGNPDPNTKLKCFPAGWVLKNIIDGARFKEYPEVNPLWRKVTDPIDNIDGWIKKDSINDDPTKQTDLKEMVKTLSLSPQPEESGMVPEILEAVDHYYHDTATENSLYNSNDKMNCFSVFKLKGFNFEENLQKGSSGCDVIHLQIILQKEGVEIYPEGLITGLFGDKTEVALKKFQEKYSLQPSGIADEQTRIKLNDILLNWPETSTFPIELILSVVAVESGITNFNNENVSFDYGHGIMQTTFAPVKRDIERLQMVLKNEPSYQKDGKEIVIYPEGLITGEFKLLTEAAVKRFQEKYGVSETYKDINENIRMKVGPLTRIKLNDVLNSKRSFFEGLGIPQNFRFEDFLRVDFRDRTNPDNAFDSRGAGSALEVPPCDNIKDETSANHYKKCYEYDSSPTSNEYKNYTPHEEYQNRLFKYYANTSQSTYANIKDGLNILRLSYTESLFRNRNSSDIIKLAGALWRYNHGFYGTIEPKDKYLGSIAKALATDNSDKTIEIDFGDYKNTIPNNRFLTVDERNELVDKFTNYLAGEIKSPVELRLYDSSGRVTGLLNGEEKNEIPKSDYFDGKFIIYSPSDSYMFEVAGKELGEYGLEISNTLNGGTIGFQGIELPINQGEVHQYVLDWATLQNNEKGVTLKVDYQGDGIFDQTLVAGKELIGLPKIISPKLDAKYILNSQLQIQFSATDEVSGISTVTATLNGLSIDNNQLVVLDKVGTNTFEVVAMNNAGNTATTKQDFNVVYTFNGFLPPILADGSGVYKLGRTLPIKFQLIDVNNNYVLDAIADLSFVKITNSILGDEEIPLSTSTADVGNQFRYDQAENQYIYNLSTKNLISGSWQINVKLNDNGSYPVKINIRN